MKYESPHIEGGPKFFEVKSEGCSARLGKGQSAKDVPSHILVMDTGQPWTPEPEKRHPKTQAELDALYRETISHGIIDHHGIDVTVLDLPAGVERKCATKMIADFPTEVLEQIRKRSISSITAHFDSDFDSICSTYLAKALVQSNKAEQMPKITSALGDVANLDDYGRSDASTAEAYAATLPGLFGGLKEVLVEKQRAEMGAIWGDKEKDVPMKQKASVETSARYTQYLIDLTFELLNSCEAKLTKDGAIDLQKIDLETLPLSERLHELLKAGIQRIAENFKKYDADLEKAERAVARVQSKTGEMIDVPLLIFRETTLGNPLVTTNMTYRRAAPETITVVFGGADRKGGDHYDVGMKVETAALFDLKSLLMPLNAAEAEARKTTFANLDSLVQGNEQPTTEQQALLDRWKLTPITLAQKWSTLRKDFEATGHGDPTVVVAGGSLVAASGTSLLSAERFVDVVKTALVSPDSSLS